MKYSIIIPTYNHLNDYLIPCINSIERYTDLDNYEIIVVANGCSDQTEDYLKSKPNIKGLVFEQALGFTKSVNIGIENSLGEYIIILNNDIELLPQTTNQWIKMLEDPFSDPKVAVTGPHCIKDNYSEKEFIVFFCTMIKKSILKQFNNLDEIFSPGFGEDIDFCLKVQNAGYKFVHVGKHDCFPIWHKDNGTFGEIADYSNKIVKRNGKILKERYNKKEILCSISTRGRYLTTLPSVLFAVINQTKLPDHLIIFDDNDLDKRIDLRKQEIYQHIFKLLDMKNISWEVVFGQRKGQHYNHQIANRMGYKWVWRVDDDVIPEPKVLQTLYEHCHESSTVKVGAVGGSIICPTWDLDIDNPKNVSGKIEDIYFAQNPQWFKIKQYQKVDHLHCSFLYRAGIVDYNLNLSRIAHREETIFTWQLKNAGYEIVLAANAISYHLKAKEGGIRDGQQELYIHDEEIFKQVLNLSDNKLVILDSGIGDHIVFKSILPELLEKYNNIVIGCCYPYIFEDYPDIKLISIAEAKKLINDDELNIYKKMADWNWRDSLQNAYRKLYL